MLRAITAYLFVASQTNLIHGKLTIRSVTSSGAMRRVVSGAVAIFSYLPLLPTDATFGVDASYSRPTPTEIQNVFIGPDWNDIDSRNVFTEEDFRRLDESPDSIFYSEPRFVEHVNPEAVKALTRYHENELKFIAKSLYNRDSPVVDVLDVCSSWVSHLPDVYNVKPPLSNVVGIGLNEQELRRNPQLSSYLVKDLNKEPKLPFENNSFDVVLLQLSIDYLIHPVQIMEEISRVLRPNGEALISFSNRLFFNKAVSIWTGQADIDHIETVGTYMRDAFSKMQAIDVTTSNSDPMYIVKGTK